MNARPHEETYPLVAYQQPANDVLISYSYPNYGQGNSAKSLGNYFSLLYRRRWFILFFSLICALLALLLAFLMNPEYVAKSTLKIETDSTKILNYDVDASPPPSYVDDIVFYNTQYKLLRSKALAKRVIDDLGIRDYLLNERLFKPVVYEISSPITQLRKSLSALLAGDSASQGPDVSAEDIFLKNLVIRPVKNSKVIDLEYVSNTAELSQQVLNKLTENFINSRHESRNSAASQAEKYLNAQLVAARERLETAEAKVVDYARKKNLVDIDPGQPVLQKTLESLTNAYMQAKEYRIKRESMYMHEKQLAGESNANDSSLIQQYKAELNRLQGEYASNAQIFKPNYPTMLSLQGNINSVKQKIVAEEASIKQITADNLKSSFESALREENKLQDEIAKTENNLLQHKDKIIEYLPLQRDVETSRTLYEGLLQRLKEINVVGDIKADDITIVDAASLPLKKSSPVFYKYLVVGLFSGLMLASLFVLLREAYRQRVYDHSSLGGGVEKYPLLASIPNVKALDADALSLLSVQKPYSKLAEAFRNLNVKLLNNPANTMPQVIHVTSTLPGEGKSTTAINLAGLLASGGKKVLLIDADIRKPTVHKRLHLDNAKGLTTYLSGYDTDFPLWRLNKLNSLFAICAGPAVPDPVNLLSSPAVAKMLIKARSVFDHIVIDSPPVLGMADALVLSHRADATLLVIASGRPSQKEVAAAISNLEHSGAKISGILFSMVKEKNSNSYANYDYSDGREMLYQ